MKELNRKFNICLLTAPKVKNQALDCQARRQVLFPVSRYKMSTSWVN